MKKALIFLGTVLAFASGHVAFAACTPVSSTYPGSLDTFVANDCIPSSWANTLESTIGTTTATSSLVQRINSISSSTATTTITASGTLSGPSFTFGTSTTITPAVSGTAIDWNLINTGNWAGTWQGVNSSTFYLASNPSGFISTSTGLTTGNFASANISQWTNNSGYITTSTNNFGGLTNASVTALSPILWSATSTITCPTCIATNTGNWAGTWQGINSSTFYLASNPSNFASAASTVANYVPYWTSSASTTLSASSSLYLNNSQVAIGTTTFNGLFSVVTNSTTTNAMTIDANGNVFFGSATDTSQSMGVSSTVSFVNPGNNNQDSYVDFVNRASGKGEYFLINASSSFENLRIEQGAYASQWDLGMFGSTAFSVYDDVDGTTPFTITKAAPSNSLVIAASGAIDIATSSSAGLAKLYVAGQVKLSFIVNATSTTATTTIDFSQAERQMITLGSATTTVYVTNTENGDTDALKLCQDGTGSRTVTWAASSTNTSSTIDWGVAAAPTLSTGAYRCDWFSFITAPADQNNASSVVDGAYGANGYGN